MPMKVAVIPCLLLSMLVGSTGGCWRGPQTAQVTGTVTLDGKPLDDASIEFDHDNGTPPTTLNIVAGSFSGDVLLGKKTVRFFALRPSKPNPRLSPTDVQNPFENILPNKYGYDSQLTIEVTSDIKDKPCHYELKSK